MTDGIEGLLIETHNWGKTVALWQGLGYVLEFETDHHSGQLRHPRGGPFLFIAERPSTQALQIVPMVAVSDPATFTPPHAATIVRPFERQHWPVLEMLLGDPDGRSISVQAPAPSEAPHG
ncbi:MAG: VOC family protein [Deltaproteobacteria bacterium]|nr:VOC family protein [Deltaproteobacteria bacterium]